MRYLIAALILAAAVGISLFMRWWYRREVAARLSVFDGWQDWGCERTSATCVQYVTGAIARDSMRWRVVIVGMTVGAVCIAGSLWWQEATDDDVHRAIVVNCEQNVETHDFAVTVLTALVDNADVATDGVVGQLDRIDQQIRGLPDDLTPAGRRFIEQFLSYERAELERQLARATQIAASRQILLDQVDPLAPCP
jgi:hypothetical protein